jgi:hypothetical protein
MPIDWDHLERRMKPYWEQLFAELDANDEKKIVWLKDNNKKTRSTNNTLIHRKKSINVPNMFDGDYNV